jgi:hypothetical protein
MKEFEGRSMRANVSVGTAGETILEHGFEQKIAEPRHAGPTLYVGLTMRSEIEEFRVSWTSSTREMDLTRERYQTQPLTSQ